MMKTILLVVALLAFAASVPAQSLRLGNSDQENLLDPSISSFQAKLAPTKLMLQDSTSMALQRWRMGYQILPSYARENPSGYSFLCRLELKAEDKLPIGLWFRADGGTQQLVPTFPQTYVQFKLLRF